MLIFLAEAGCDEACVRMNLILIIFVLVKEEWERAATAVYPAHLMTSWLTLMRWTLLMRVSLCFTQRQTF